MLHDLIEKAWKPMAIMPETISISRLPRVNIVPGDMITIVSPDDNAWAFTKVEAWLPDLSSWVNQMVFRHACFLVTGVWVDKKFLSGVYAVKLLAYGVVKVRDPVMLSFSNNGCDREIENGDIFVTNTEVLRVCKAQIIHRASHGD